MHQDKVMCRKGNIISSMSHKDKYVSKQEREV